MKKSFIVAGAFVLMTFSVAGAQGYSYTRDLMVGASGTDVAQLQTQLISAGFDIPAISSSAVAKGYFGLQTMFAVQRYQAANGIPATGYVGPLTRARLSGGNPPPSQNITLISPNGGEQWEMGSIQTIRWTPGNTASQVSIYLVVNASGCFNLPPGQACLAIVDPQYTVAANVSNTGAYTWSAGQTYEKILLSPGSYYLRICQTTSTGAQICDTSNKLFTLRARGTDNTGAPVISGVDAPTTLAVGQTGTWNVHMTDSLNGQLSYAVDWGDGPVCPSGYVCSLPGASPPSSTSQTSSFTHAYTGAGTYTVRFTVTNSSGRSSQTTATVTVTGSQTTGAFRLTSPNGGENWPLWSTQNITWTAPQYFVPTFADIYLVEFVPMPTCAPNMACPAYLPNPKTYEIKKNIPINQNSYSWRVGDYVPPVLPSNVGITAPIAAGTYYMKICTTGTSICDQSDATFTVSANTTLPDINILSPNGGENLDITKPYPVRVNITGNSADVGNLVNLYVVDSKNTQTFIGNYAVMAGQNTWNINFPQISLPYSYRESYRLYATLFKNNQMQAYDYSDAPFYPYYPCPSGYVCN